MIRQTKRKLGGAFTRRNLVRGRSQSLPYPTAAFRRVASTFPSEYVFDPETLGEIFRILKPGGKFVMIPSAWITERSFPHRLAALLFRFTQTSQSDSSPDESVFGIVVERLCHHGFLVSKQIINCKNSQVLVIIAEKQWLVDLQTK